MVLMLKFLDSSRLSNCHILIDFRFRNIRARALETSCRVVAESWAQANGEPHAARNNFVYS